MNSRWSWWMLLAAPLFACSAGVDGDEGFDFDASLDGSVGGRADGSASGDAGVDTGTRRDSGPEGDAAVPEGGMDASLDASQDASEDASMDGAKDAAVGDAGMDADAADASVDADAGDADAGDADAGDATPAMLVVTQDVAVGYECEFGGSRELSGLDDGQPGGTADDGQLSESEVDAEQVTCLDAPPAEKVAATGLDTLPANTTCAAPSGTSFVAGVAHELVFENLVFPINDLCTTDPIGGDCTNAFRPTAMEQHPSTGDWYLLEQSGRVLTFENEPDATLVEVALDIRDDVVSGYEAGLLNLSFDPDNPDHVYLYRITCNSVASPPAVPVVCEDGNELREVYGVVSRFTLLPDGTLDPSSERLILELVQDRTEHNGGGARFGPDGHLYVALGDGGDFPPEHPQDGSSLLGKVLRLAVKDELGNPYDGADPAYTIPDDNPFVDDPEVLDEIYAIGFRNPWRFDFDATSGGDEPVRLVLGDVGLVTAEEINLVEPGKNYGWPLMEGYHCRPTGAQANRVTVLPDAACTPDPMLTPPVQSYRQAQGVSVTGGFSYRGSEVPALEGMYVFSDFSLGNLRAFPLDDPTAEPTYLFRGGAQITSFAQGLDGEIYYFDWYTGRIRKLVAADVSDSRPAALLSETGCVHPDDPREPAPGGLRYGVQSPLFSEGLYKTRWIYFPEGNKATEYDDTGNLILQPGTVLVKHFDLGPRRIETRLMTRHPDGEWTGWSYRWREDQSDADLLEGAFEEDLGDLRWRYPSNGECHHCHTFPSGRVLGFRIEQLNGLAYYPSTDRWANQVDTLRAVGRLDRVLIGEPGQPVVPSPESAEHPAFPRPDDATASTTDRVGAYLFSNCAHCHRPAGGGRGNFNLLYGHLSSLCNTRPSTGTYDNSDLWLIDPGSPAQSMVYLRMTEQVLPYRMHPYRIRADDIGGPLLVDWINGEAADVCGP